MARHLDRIGKVAFGAAMVGVLSFGATQALAAPSATMQAAACTDHDRCEVYCQYYGYVYGKCMNGACWCYTGSGWVLAP